jgi:hypothetical protein
MSIGLALSFLLLLPALAVLALPRAGKLLSPAEWLPSFSGGLLAGLALLVVLPESSESADFVSTILPFGLGFAISHLLDRYAHPICPACDSSPNVWTLLPLWTALSTHSFVDGALLGLADAGTLASWFLLLHRIPELLSTAVLLRMAKRSASAVGVGILLLQGFFCIGYAGASGLDLALLYRGYAFSGGALLFLGLHRLHESWERAELRFGHALGGMTVIWATHQALHRWSAH